MIIITACTDQSRQTSLSLVLIPHPPEVRTQCGCNNGVIRAVDAAKQTFSTDHTHTQAFTSSSPVWKLVPSYHKKPTCHLYAYMWRVSYGGGSCLEQWKGSFSLLRSCFACKMLPLWICIMVLCKCFTVKTALTNSLSAGLFLFFFLRPPPAAPPSNVLLRWWVITISGFLLKAGHFCCPTPASLWHLKAWGLLRTCPPSPFSVCYCFWLFHVIWEQTVIITWSICSSHLLKSSIEMPAINISRIFFIIPSKLFLPVPEDFNISSASMTDVRSQFDLIFTDVHTRFSIYPRSPTD